MSPKMRRMSDAKYIAQNMKVSKITRYFLYLLAYVVLLAANPVSCSTQSENKYCKITLKQNVPIDEYVKSYDGYIPLETTDESLINDLTLIEVTDLALTVTVNVAVLTP